MLLLVPLSFLGAGGGVGILPTELPIELAIETTDEILATAFAVTLPIKFDTLFEASTPSVAQGFAPGGNEF